MPVEPGNSASRFSIPGFWVLVLVVWFPFADDATAQNRHTRRILSCEGPFAATMTPQSLAQAFGNENVTEEDIHLGEGYFETGTVLFSKTPHERLEILWTDEIERRVSTIVLRGPKSLWQTAGGLTLGVTLRLSERLNRRPFRLRGFGWDYGGAVTHWANGLLDTAAEGVCRIGARFAPVQNDLGEFVNGTEKYVFQVSGEREFSSGHPAMQALDPVISEIFVRYQNR